MAENENKGTAVRAEKTDAAPQRKRTRFRTAKIVVAVMVLLHIIAGFPFVSYNGKIIPVFSARRFLAGPLDALSQKGFNGRVLGGHVLETGYGEIRRKNLAPIRVWDGTISKIDASVFRSGQASHNLVIEGIKIPANITFYASRGRPISLMVLDRQEVTVSGVPIIVDGWIDFEREKFIYESPVIGTADFKISSRFPQEYVTLADSMQINVAKVWCSLYIYKDEKQWVLFVPNSTPLLAKLPGESEFTGYSSITFGENWGGFIEGELFEEE